MSKGDDDDDDDSIKTLLVEKKLRNSSDKRWGYKIYYIAKNASHLYSLPRQLV